MTTAGLIVVLLSALLVLVSTATGVQLLLRVAAPLIPGSLQIEAVDGSLRSPLSLTGVLWEDAGLRVTADAIEIRWQPLSLLEGQLLIDRLSAVALAVHLAPASEPELSAPAAAEPFSLPTPPLRIAITALALRDFRLVEAAADPAAAPTVAIPSADVALLWTATRLAAEDLELEFRAGDAEVFVGGALALLSTPAAALAECELVSDLSYLVSLPSTGYPALAGELRTSQQLQALAVAHDLAAPYGSTLTGTIFGLPAAPRFELQLAAPALDPSAIQASWLAAALELDLALTGTLDQWQADLAVTGNAGPRWQGTITGALAGQREQDAAGLTTAQRLEIDALQLVSSFGELRSSGSVRLGEALTAQLTLDAVDLDPTEFAPAWAGAIDANLDLAVRWPDLADWRTLDADLARLRLGGNLRGGDLGGTVSGIIRDGVLAVEPASRLRWGANRIALSGNLDAAADSLLTLDLALREPELISELKASGAVAGLVTVRGTSEALVSSARLRVTDWQMTGLKIAGADLAWDLIGTETGKQQLQLAARSVELGERAIDALALSLQGTLADHQLSLRADNALGELRGDLTGSLSDLAGWSAGTAAYQFGIAELVADASAGHRLQLTAGGHGSVAVDGWSVTESCFALSVADAPGGSLCAAARQDAAGLGLDYDLSQLSIDGLLRFLDRLPIAAEPFAETLSAFAGSVSGQIDGAGRLLLPATGGQLLTGDALVTVSDFELLRVGADPEEPEEPALVLRGDRLRLALDAGTAIGQVTLSWPLTVMDYSRQALTGGPAVQVAAPFPLGGSLSAALSLGLDAPDWAAVGLAGEAQAALESLAFLAALTPEVTRAAGRLDAAVQLAGSLGAPVVTGSATVADGAVALVTPELNVANVALRIEPQDAAAEQFSLRGSASSGGGSLELAGTVDLAGAEPALALAVNGQDFLLSNTAQARLWASPALQLAFADNRLKVTGAVVVPRAELRLKQFPPSAVVASEDAVVLRNDEAADAAALAVDARVKVTLGDAVTFQGFGLSAGFTGQLEVRQRAGEQPFGRGEINILDGRYRAYGQNLAIERGRAIWADTPIAEPGVDLRAFRKPRAGILVGVQARGPLSAPRTSLFSEPAMPESDQLSYLVLGRPMEDNASSEQSLLSQAALALGIRGGNFLSEQFGGKLGVDQIGIETEAGAGADQAAFVVGKYLSPKLYVSYGLGLLDAVSRIKLEYLLSSRWRLATESSTLSSGGDLIYSIERD